MAHASFSIRMCELPWLHKRLSSVDKWYFLLLLFYALAEFHDVIIGKVDDGSICKSA